jgi:membrane-associated phospholipid phosphatase
VAVEGAPAPTPTDEQVDSVDPWVRWAPWRRRAIVVWCVALLVFIVTRGVPFERTIQTAWILAGLFAFSIGKSWRQYGRILLDWLPFVGFLMLYDYTRGLADWFGRPVHVTEPLDAETWLFHGVVPTQWLQQHLYDSSNVRWYDVLVALVYVSHFVVVWAYAAVLYLTNRERWGKWARRILLLSYAGLVTYIVYPAAPPWYAADQGLIPGVVRIASRGFEAVHLHAASALISQAQGRGNDVAAMPSLHGAFTAMLTVFLWPRLPNWGRVLMVLYTFAMGFSLVYGGEHYVVDILMGYAYVAGVLLLCWWWERLRERQRAAKAAKAAAGASDDGTDPAYAVTERPSA